MKSEQAQLVVRSLGHSGEGVGAIDGYTIFVDGVLPKETALVEIETKKKTYGKARLIKLITRSEARVEPPCPYFGRCGGCQIMHLGYLGQLESKRQRVVDALFRIGKMGDIPVEPCLASPSVFGYRNKIQLPVRNVDGKLSLGLYEKNSHHLIPIERCLIHCEQGERVFQHLLSILSSSHLSAYDPETNTGELRHVLIKSSFDSKENLVVFVTSKPPTKELQQLAKKLQEKEPSVSTVIHNKHSGFGNVILGEEYTTLLGSGFIIETLDSLLFRISAASFFQVNPQQAVNLYQKALELANLTGTETVLDAYCGVGTLSLFFSRFASKVIGVESVSPAIEDAKYNAASNQIENVQFFCDLAESFMERAPPIDLLLVNPPRKGCDPSFLQGVKRLKPKKLIYISCDPATLARDLAILKGFGYTIGTVQPVDMFPQTSHVECVVSCLFSVSL